MVEVEELGWSLGSSDGCGSAATIKFLLAQKEIKKEFKWENWKIQKEVEKSFASGK